MKGHTIRDVVAGLGLIAAIGGIAWLHLPSSLIVGGLIVIALSIVHSMATEDTRDPVDKDRLRVRFIHSPPKSDEG